MRVFLCERNAGDQAEDGLFICRYTLEIPPFKIGTLLFQVSLKQDWMGHFIRHGAALPFACILIFTMQQHPLFRQFFAFAGGSFFLFIRLFLNVSSDESALIGERYCASELNSGERMFAGVDCIADDRTSAKPPWSEVIVFLAFLLRQSNSTIISEQQKKSQPPKCEADPSSDCSYCLMMDTTRAPSTSIVTLSPALMNGNCLSIDTLAI